MEKPKDTASSRLLLHEEPLQVLPGLAVALGLNEAIIVQQLHYWLRKKPHVRDGHNWHYNTYEEWRKQFPFWSVSTIKRAIVSLEKKGVIRAANYNNSNIDKTKWYTINYLKLDELHDSSMAHIDLSTAQYEPSTGHNDLSTAQNEPSTGQYEPSMGSNCPHQFPETNTETTNKDKEEPPSLTLPPEGGMEEGDVTAASFNRPAQLQTKEVLTHLITVSGIQYKTAGLITRRLADGATIEDCTLVIDWWAKCWSVKRPDQRDLLDPTTPFKGGKFQEYLAKARQWDEQGRTTPGPTGSKVSAKGLRNLAITQQLLKEDGIL